MVLSSSSEESTGGVRGPVESESDSSSEHRGLNDTTVTIVVPPSEGAAIANDGKPGREQNDSTSESDYADDDFENDEDVSSDDISDTDGGRGTTLECNVSDGEHGVVAGDTAPESPMQTSQEQLEPPSQHGSTTPLGWVPVLGVSEVTVEVEGGVEVEVGAALEVCVTPPGATCARSAEVDIPAAVEADVGVNIPAEVTGMCLGALIRFKSWSLYSVQCNFPSKDPIFCDLPSKYHLSATFLENPIHRNAIFHYRVFCSL
jgi:hypothetical protein